MVLGPPLEATIAQWQQEKAAEVEAAEMAYQQARAVIARVKSVEMDRLHRQIRIEEQQPTLQRDMRILLKQQLRTEVPGPMAKDLRKLIRARSNRSRQAVRARTIRCGDTISGPLAVEEKLPHPPLDCNDVAAWRAHVHGVSDTEDCEMETQLIQDMNLWEELEKAPSSSPLVAMSAFDQANFVEQMARELGVSADQIRLSC